MKDFHTHILPGIDDGSRDVKTSIEMLREEACAGIDEIVATPHFYASEGDIDRFLRRRTRAWDALREALTDELPNVRLGAEVQYFEGIRATENLEALRIEGSELLLVEMPMRRWSRMMLDDIYEINSRPGIQVVLAHVDRYLEFIGKDMIEDLASRGLLIQVNTSYFLDWRTRGRAKKQLRNGYLHFFGTDCHNLTSRSPNWKELKPKTLAEIKAVAEDNEHYWLK